MQNDDAAVAERRGIGGDDGGDVGQAAVPQGVGGLVQDIWQELIRRRAGGRNAGRQQGGGPPEVRRGLQQRLERLRNRIPYRREPAPRSRVDLQRDAEDSVIARGAPDPRLRRGGAHGRSWGRRRRAAAAPPRQPEGQGEPNPDEGARAGGVDVAPADEGPRGAASRPAPHHAGAPVPGVGDGIGEGAGPGRHPERRGAPNPDQGARPGAVDVAQRGVETTPDSQLPIILYPQSRRSELLTLQIHHPGRTSQSLAFKIKATRHSPYRVIPSHIGIVAPDSTVSVDILVEDEERRILRGLGQEALDGLNDEFFVKSVAVSDALATRFWSELPLSGREVRARMWNLATSGNSVRVFDKKLLVRYVRRGEDDVAGDREGAEDAPLLGDVAWDAPAGGEDAAHAPNPVRSGEDVSDDLRGNEGIVQHEGGAHDEADAMDGVEFEGERAPEGDAGGEPRHDADVGSDEDGKQEGLADEQDGLLEGLCGLTISQGPGDDSLEETEQITAAPEPMDVETETEAEAEQSDERMGGDEPSHPGVDPLMLVTIDQPTLTTLLRWRALTRDDEKAMGTMRPGCSEVNYCSQVCQVLDWRIHKDDCEQMKRLRLEEEDRRIAVIKQEEEDHRLAQLVESSGININELIGSPTNRKMSARDCCPHAPTKAKVPICFEVGSACHVTGLEHLLRQELRHCPICERHSANCVHCDDTPDGAPCTEFGCRGCLELRECDTCSKLCCENCLQLATNGEYELVDTLVCRTCFDEIPPTGNFRPPCDMENTVFFPEDHPGVTLRNILGVHTVYTRGDYKFQCRNDACEKGSEGARNDDYCKGCYNRFQRGNITFQPRPEFDEDLASIGFDRIAAAEGSTVQWLKRQYVYLTVKDRNDLFWANYRNTATPHFVVPADAALARLLLNFVVTGQVDGDVNFGAQRPQRWKHYFAMRQRDVAVIQHALALDNGEESDLPSMQNSWKKIAEWLNNKIKRRDGFANDWDRRERIKLVLHGLRKPSNLQRLFVGEDFVAQVDGDGLWDLHKRSEPFYRVFDEYGHLRSQFRVNGNASPTSRRVMLQGLINTIKEAFRRDVERRTSGPNAPWAGREAEGEQFLALLEHLSASIASGANSANAFFENWQEQMLQELEAKREEARTRRAGEEEDIVGLEDAVREGYSVDDLLESEYSRAYVEWRRDKDQATKEQLKQSETYRLFVEAQNTRGCVDDLQPLKDIVLREFGFEWSQIATFSDDMYSKGNSHQKKQFLGSAMRGIIWRIRKRCVFPGCSRVAANHSDPGARYAYHDDHEDLLMDPLDVSKLADPSTLTDDIPTMVDEIFDCTFQKCNMHHDQKVLAEYFIPASKLRNNLDYPNGTVHRDGRELAEDFDVVVFVLGLLAVGAYHSYLDTPISSDNLTAWTYRCFRLDLHDAVDWEGERLDARVETNGRMCTMNDVLMGSIDKLSGKCANPACSEDCMREMPWGKNGHHWDHEGGKEVAPTRLRHYSVLNLLNELGRYCALTCAMCHGIKTRLNDLGFLGRVFVHP